MRREQNTDNIGRIAFLFDRGLYLGENIVLKRSRFIERNMAAHMHRRPTRHRHYHAAFCLIRYFNARSTLPLNASA